MSPVGNGFVNDFEFTLMTEGHMLYSINNERIELNAGDMVFVNSARMHYGYWEKRECCTFICVVFSLQMLSAVPECEIKKITGNDAPPFILIAHDDIHGKDVTNGIKKLHEVCSQQSEGYKIKAAALCCEIAYGIFRLCSDTVYYSAENMKKLSAVHAMTGYLQGHYFEALTLDDIASA